MSTVEARLQLMRSKIDEWSIREKLILASAVDRSGDQNWMSVSRLCKPFAEPGRPKDWFSQKNCAVQYEALLEAAELPKRKKRNTTGDKKEETISQMIVRTLTELRIAELKKSMAEKQAKYLRLKEEVAMIDAGLADDRLEEWTREAEEAKRQKVIDAEKHALWLKEREEKKAELERAWKPSFCPPMKRKLPLQDQRRNSNHSELSSEADSVVDSPLAEPLNVDTLGEASTSTETRQPTPTSPLLTSLLKTPPPVTTTQSSILHSAITSQRGSSPTITSLLSSSPSVPHTGSVSQAFKPFAPSTLTHEEPKAGPASAVPMAPLISAAASSVGAPTLSMLLELPPSVPGKPLPRVETVERPPIVTSPLPDDLCHPQHQEMRVRKETESDEILEVVEIDQSLELDERSEEMEIGLEEIIANLEASEDSSENLIEEEVVVTEITTSDSSSLFDSLLRSECNTRTKYIERKRETSGYRVESGGNVAQSFKETGSRAEVMHPVVESIENIVEIACTVSNDKSVSSGISPHTHELQPEVIEIVEAETEIPHAEFDAKTLAEMEIIIMDQVEELEIQEIKEVQDLESSMSVKKREDDSPVKDVGVEVISEAEKDLSTVPEVHVESKTNVETNDAQSCSPVKCSVEVCDVKVVDSPTSISTEKSDIFEDLKIPTKRDIEADISEGPEAPEELQGNNSVSIDTPTDSKSENILLLEEQDKTNDNVLPQEEIPKDKNSDELILDVPKSTAVVKSDETANADLPTLKENESQGNIVETKSHPKKGRKPKEKGSQLKAKEEGKPLKKKKIKVVKSKEETVPKVCAIVEATAQEVKAKDVTIQEALAKDTKDSEVVLQETPTAKIKDSEDKESLSPAKVTEPYDRIKAAKIRAMNSRLSLSYRYRNKSLVTDVQVKDAKAKDLETKVSPMKDMKAKNSQASEKTKELKPKEVSPKQSLATDIPGNNTLPGGDMLANPTRGKESPVKESPVKESSVKESPVKESSVKESPVKESSVKESPVKESAIKESPVKVLAFKEKSKGIKVKNTCNVSKTKDIKSKENKTKESKVLATTSDTSPNLKTKETKGIDTSVKDTPTYPTKSKEEKKSKNVKTKESKLKNTSVKEATPTKETRKTKEALVKDSKSKGTLTFDDLLTTEKKGEILKEVKVKDKKGKAKLKTVEEKSKVSKDLGRKVKSKLKLKSIEKPLSVDSSDAAMNSDDDVKEKKIKIADNEILDIALDVPSAKEAIPIDTAVEINLVEKSSSLFDEERAEFPGHTTMELQDVDNSPDNSFAQESCDSSEVKQYCEASTSKPETVVENRPESPLTETSDAEVTVGSIRSFGRLTETDDSVPNSPGSSLTDDEREYRAWKKAIMLVWSRISGHKYASLFLKPITDDQAPRYSLLVKRPLDLITIKKNIETGATRCTEEFQRDILLMFLNAQMYNSCRHNVFHMAKIMQEDSLQLIKDFVETQKLVQSACETPSVRRETRTTDSSKRDDSDEPRTPVSFKRKRLADLEKSPQKKK